MIQKIEKLICEVGIITEKILLTAYLFYLSGKKPFNSRDIKDKFFQLGLKTDFNSSDLLKNLYKKNYIMPDVKKKNGLKSWIITYGGRKYIGEKYLEELEPEIKNDNQFEDLVPEEILEGYFNKILIQVNGCYRKGFHDACLAMIRKLIENLIIEVYERLELSDQIKDEKGNYFLLKKLIEKITDQREIKLSRDAKRGLKTVKILGDNATHNPRIIFTKPEIDNIKSILIVTIKELMYYIKNNQRKGGDKNSKKKKYLRDT